MVINDKQYPLIGVWVEERGKPVRQAFSTAYLDDASYQAAYSYAMAALRDRAVSVSLRAYAMDHYHKSGAYTKGHSVTLNIYDYRDLSANVSQEEVHYLDA